MVDQHPSEKLSILVETSQEERQADVEPTALSTDDSIHLGAEENSRVLRKIDRHLMPIMTVIYFLHLMDRQTLAFASVFGLPHDAGLVGEQYSLLGSVVFIAQAIVQPFAAYFLVKFRLSLYIPTIVICWGATLAAMATAKSFDGLLVTRFLLGVFETSIQAAFILVTQRWYRRREQGTRVAIWYSNNGWVNVFGSLLTYGLGHIKSAFLHPYQIIFLALGTITVVIGGIAFFFFPDGPSEGKFLTQRERLVAAKRVETNKQGLQTTEFAFEQVKEALIDLKTYLFALAGFCSSLPATGFSIFGPLILKNLGYDDFDVMLFMIPYGVLQLITLGVSFWVSWRFKNKSLVAIAGMIPHVASTLIFLQTGRSQDNQKVHLAGFYLFSLHNAVWPTMLSWQAANVAGQTKKTVTSAALLLGIISGSIVGPLLFIPGQKPYFRTGMLGMLTANISGIFFVVVIVLRLRYLNAWNEQRRVAVGKPAKIIDYSMLTSEELQRLSIEPTDESVRNAEDLTDLQNDEFIYVY